jgi:pilus assembly protein Flp/PilA
MAMKQSIGKLYRNCRGATAVEYGLILSLVVLASMAALLAFANTSVGIWNDVATQVKEAR